MARKIAAGEVIDRPFSVVRELIDNSLDSGADSLEIRIEAGGTKSIQIKDNGCGMTREDLELCCLPHATSKIVHEEDLDRILSLGFRGEALAAIAACTALTITTATADGSPGHRLRLVEGSPQEITVFPAKPGTIVLCEDLFYSIPARKNFLKSPGSEASICRKMIEEKALAFPSVRFVFYSDGQKKLDLPPQTREERLLQLYGYPLSASQLRSFAASGKGFALAGLVSKPELKRADRKEIHIYANKRKIQEFSLVQAVCYALEDYLPGGVFPYGWVFLEVEPHLVDFNIHPAKKEARFRNLPEIHKALVEAIKTALQDQKLTAAKALAEAPVEQTLFSSPTEGSAPAGGQRWQGPAVTGRVVWPDSAEEAPAKTGFFQAYQQAIQGAPPVPGTITRQDFRYVGQILNLFLVVEMRDSFYLIDQHAAHERILYEGYKQGRQQIQNLLVPVEFHLETDEAEVLASLLERYKALGVGIEAGNSPGHFRLVHIPLACAFLEGEIITFIRNLRGVPEDLERDLYATMSCRAAIMDGDAIDRGTALDLIEKAFALEDARCPHGRPIWIRYSRRELYEKFGRLI